MSATTIKSLLSKANTTILSSASPAPSTATRTFVRNASVLSHRDARKYIPSAIQQPNIDPSNGIIKHTSASPGGLPQQSCQSPALSRNASDRRAHSSQLNHHHHHHQATRNSSSTISDTSGNNSRSLHMQQQKQPLSSMMAKNPDFSSAFVLSPQVRFILRPPKPTAQADSIADRVLSGKNKTTRNQSSSPDSVFGLNSGSNGGLQHHQLQRQQGQSSMTNPPPPPNNIGEARRRVNVYLEELHGVVDAASRILQELAQNKQAFENHMKSLRNMRASYASAKAKAEERNDEIGYEWEKVYRAAAKYTNSQRKRAERNLSNGVSRNGNTGRGYLKYSVTTPTPTNNNTTAAAATISATDVASQVLSMFGISSGPMTSTTVSSGTGIHGADRKRKNLIQKGLSIASTTLLSRGVLRERFSSPSTRSLFVFKNNSAVLSAVLSLCLALAIAMVGGIVAWNPLTTSSTPKKRQQQQQQQQQQQE
ncbi:hypothetical protein H4219_002182 [Mycoemilia scoparia]|uniref:Uncharacterized protein n=1 Tax=Mycoemilia scoparia TaxID=417184 RepID=A0A9W8A415_9FUNG|nr:hypothetical protein H4219_002182 [Mycoemilia scoparia]